jgi:hypothetical protein
LTFPASYFLICNTTERIFLGWVKEVNSTHLNVRVRVRVTLRLAVYSQSVRLGVKPLETHDQSFFSQLNPCGHSPYITCCLRRGWVCRFQFLLVLANAVILGSESLGTYRTENIVFLLLHLFVSAEKCLLDCSIATAVRVTSRIVTIPLLLRAGITQQRLFLWLHNSSSEHICHRILPRFSVCLSVCPLFSGPQTSRIVDRIDWCNDVIELYSGGARFESLPEHRLS